MYENYCNVAPAKAGVQAQLQPQHLFFEKFITANNNQSQIKYSKTFLYIHGLKSGSRPSDFAKATTDRSPGRPRLRIKLSAVAPDFAQPVRQSYLSGGGVATTGRQVAMADRRRAWPRRMRLVLLHHIT